MPITRGCPIRQTRIEGLALSEARAPHGIRFFMREMFEQTSAVAADSSHGWQSNPTDHRNICINPDARLELLDTERLEPIMHLAAVLKSTFHAPTA